MARLLKVITDMKSISSVNSAHKGKEKVTNCVVTKRLDTHHRHTAGVGTNLDMSNLVPDESQRHLCMKLDLYIYYLHRIDTYLPRITKTHLSRMKCITPNAKYLHCKQLHLSRIKCIYTPNAKYLRRISCLWTFVL